MNKGVLCVTQNEHIFYHLLADFHPLSYCKILPRDFYFSKYYMFIQFFYFMIYISLNHAKPN